MTEKELLRHYARLDIRIWLYYYYEWKSVTSFLFVCLFVALNIEAEYTCVCLFACLCCGQVSVPLLIPLECLSTYD